MKVNLEDMNKVINWSDLESLILTNYIYMPKNVPGAGVHILS